MEQIMENQCKLCGSPTKFKSGVSKKNGKEWKGYFCQNGDCKNVEWLRAGNSFPASKPATGALNASGRGQNDGLAIVLEEIQGIEKRLMKYLKEKLGQPNSQEDLSEIPFNEND